jgi:hypothetical protein
MRKEPGMRANLIVRLTFVIFTAILLFLFAGYSSAESDISIDTRIARADKMQAQKAQENKSIAIGGKPLQIVDLTCQQTLLVNGLITEESERNVTINTRWLYDYFAKTKLVQKSYFDTDEISPTTLFYSTCALSITDKPKAVVAITSSKEIPNLNYNLGNKFCVNKSECLEFADEKQLYEYLIEAFYAAKKYVLERQIADQEDKIVPGESPWTGGKI